MCEFTQGIRGSYQNAGVMCSVVTYKSPVDRKNYEVPQHRFFTLHVKCVGKFGMVLSYHTWWHLKKPWKYIALYCIRDITILREETQNFKNKSVSVIFYYFMAAKILGSAQNFSCTSPWQQELVRKKIKMGKREMCEATTPAFRCTQKLRKHNFYLATTVHFDHQLFVRILTPQQTLYSAHHRCNKLRLNVKRHDWS